MPSKREKSRAQKNDAFFDRLDLFAKEVPKFNFEGREKIHTHIGLITSLGVYMCVIAFACHKGIEFLRYQNPTVHKYTKYNVFTDEQNGLLI